MPTLNITKILPTIGLCLTILANTGCSLISAEKDNSIFAAYALTKKEQKEITSLFAQGHVKTVSDSTPLTLSDFLQKLENADYIILGEVHDNPLHHAIESYITRHLITTDWLKQLSLEMLKPSQTAHLSENPPIPASEVNIMDLLKDQLLWAENGWPWEDYKRLVAAAYANHIPLQAANLEKKDIMDIYSSAPPQSDLSWIQSGILKKSIIDSHCGQISAEQAQPMVSIQRARDRSMASSLRNKQKGVLLIAGAFHARKDVGVPSLLNTQERQRLLVVGMIEKGDKTLTEASALYDVIIETPKADREDPCNAFNSKSASNNKEQP